MELSYSSDHGWNILEISGDASESDMTYWRNFRREFDWMPGANVVMDATELLRPSDAFVEVLMGLTADAHHRGGRLVLVGQSDELRARICVMGMEGYISTAMSATQARTSLDVIDD
jgi:anti-anti-sigma regulatory factor